MSLAYSLTDSSTMEEVMSEIRTIIPHDEIEQIILLLRGQRVMLDAASAEALGNIRGLL